MKFLGIDFGSKRVGVSVSDDGRSIALPLTVLQNDKYILENLLKIINENEVGLVVVGESKDFSGKDNRIMKDVHRFAADLKEKSEIEVVFEPEFLSTVQAQRIQGKNEGLDASAAAIILQSYID